MFLLFVVRRVKLCIMRFKSMDAHLNALYTTTSFIPILLQSHGQPIYSTEPMTLHTSSSPTLSPPSKAHLKHKTPKNDQEKNYETRQTLFLDSVSGVFWQRPLSHHDLNLLNQSCNSVSVFCCFDPFRNLALRARWLNSTVSPSPSMTFCLSLAHHKDQRRHIASESVFVF